MTNPEIRAYLYAHADEKYRMFAQKLIPNVRIEEIIGVRLPILRKLAVEIIKNTDCDKYLAEAWDEMFEERMLQGFVIGLASGSVEQVLARIKSFLPKIGDWSVCDSFCCSLKIAKRCPEELWRFIEPLLSDKRTYYARFAFVMLLRYFVDEKHCDRAFEAFCGVQNEDYYVKMAVAWAVAEFYARLPEKTEEFIAKNLMDRWTHNKAIQKIGESRLTDAKSRARLNTMKR